MNGKNVNYPTQETEETTRPVENVALTTKGLQERNQTCEWDDGGKIGNKNNVVVLSILILHYNMYYFAL